MKKQELIQTFFQHKNKLTLSNPIYQKNVHDLIKWLIETDHVHEDRTTKTLFPASKQVTAHIITRQQTTIAGLEEISYLLTTYTTVTITDAVHDGDTLEANQTIMKITGDLKEILIYERIMLNILQRLSGIATETKKIISSLPNDNPMIAATRKTVWGPLDKKAVAIGGGVTHRLNLSDGILVKDNHLIFLKPEQALQTLCKQIEKTLIEIEVEDEQHVEQLITNFTNTSTTNVLGILLDNFTPERAKKVIAKINDHPNIISEASGGITPENINDWADTGVDLISLGALTHSPKAADVSLEII